MFTNTFLESFEKKLFLIFNFTNFIRFQVTLIENQIKILNRQIEKLIYFNAIPIPCVVNDLKIQRMHFNRLRHCLHFSSLAYYYTHRSRGRINAKVKRADQVEQSVQFFSSLLEGNISHQKLRNCCVAKQLMTHTFSVKFRVFRKEFLRNRSVYWAQIFRDN